MSTTTRPLTLLPLAALALAALALACDDFLGPGTSAEAIYIVNDGVVWELDVGTEAVAGRAYLGARTGGVVVHDEALYARTQARADRNPTLWRLDLCAMAPEWSLDLGTDADPAVYDGVTLGHGRLGVSGDGERLFVAGSSRNDSSGIAVLDARTPAVVGFIGGFHAAYARDSGPVAGFDGDVVLVTGQRQYRGPWTLYFLDAATFEVLDSVPEESLGDPYIWSAQRWGDGRSLALLGINLMLRYDVVDRAVVARRQVSWAIDWDLAPEPRVVQMGSGVETPGLLRVLGPDLEVDAEIDIRVPVDGDPDRHYAPAVEWLRISRDGTRVYVGSGSAGGFYTGAETVRVTVVDLETETVVKRIEVGGEDHPGEPVLPPTCG